MRNALYCCLCMVLLCISCGNNDKYNPSMAADYTRYASGFSVITCDGYSVVEIANPWKKDAILQRYIFAPHGASLPDSLPQGTILRTPLKNVIVYSSVHANVIRELGHVNAIKGVCDAQYFTIPEIKEGLCNGSIENIGSSAMPVAERVIALSPDAIILSPYQNSNSLELVPQGTAVVECADYMETSPLGRAEWIKLFGLMFGEETKADSIFNEVEAKYTALKEQVDTITRKPKVLSESTINGTWYVPGGRSYMAQLFHDAGAIYPWSDVDVSGSIPLDIPQVLSKAHDADVWLIKSYDDKFSYSKLKQQHALNEKFKAFADKNIYYCNTGKCSLFEDFPFHPELLLKEYISIFHSQLDEGYELKYFNPLNND